MTGVLDVTYTPIPENVAVYEELFGFYKQLHDAFGTKTYTKSLGGVMKNLLDIRDRMRI